MTVNKRIPNNFKKFSEKNSDFPKKNLDLLNEFLKTADRSELDEEQRMIVSRDEGNNVERFIVLIFFWD